jgi:hypothetical protein
MWSSSSPGLPWSLAEHDSSWGSDLPISFSPPQVDPNAVVRGCLHWSELLSTLAPSWKPQDVSILVECAVPKRCPKHWALTLGNKPNSF